MEREEHEAGKRTKWMHSAYLSAASATLMFVDTDMLKHLTFKWQRHLQPEAAEFLEHDETQRPAESSAELSGLVAPEGGTSSSDR